MRLRMKRARLRKARREPDSGHGSIIIRQTATTTYRELKGDVVFDHVDFGYSDDKMILHDIELYAKPGQKIAFVGATGAGKDDHYQSD